MNLIDRDAIPWSMDGVGDIPVITKEEIDAMPTIDTKCKDCKWADSYAAGTTAGVVLAALLVAAERG